MQCQEIRYHTGVVGIDYVEIAPNRPIEKMLALTVRIVEPDDRYLLLDGTQCRNLRQIRYSA
ncbi:MAG: hypothetical protein ACYDDO_00390 [Acidiferrobacterales bacterium]